MKGFKPTGYGPSAGFKYPQSMGFTGSTGGYTNVSPYVRRKFANGGAVRGSDPGGSTVNRKKTYAQWQTDTGSTSSLLPGYKRGGALRKADGGYVDRRYRVPRRYSDPTMSEGLRAIPPLAKEMAAAMTRGTRRAFGPKERRMGVHGDLASNYSKGGKAKRMGYSSGGSKKRMGYANGGGRRDGAMGSGASSQSNYDPWIDYYHKELSGGRYKTRKKLIEPKAAPKPAATPKGRFYAKGGGVSSTEAKKIAERTVGEHVRYPAPKGHKGLEKAMR